MEAILIVKALVKDCSNLSSWHGACISFFQTRLEKISIVKAPNKIEAILIVKASNKFVQSNLSSWHGAPISISKLQTRSKQSQVSMLQTRLKQSPLTKLKTRLKQSWLSKLRTGTKKHKKVRDSKHLEKKLRLKIALVTFHFNFRNKQDC